MGGTRSARREEEAASRRRALGLLAGLPLAPELFAAPGVPPLRLAISQSLVMDVNTNDAGAAMSIWVKRLADEMKIDVDYNPKSFDSSAEIVSRVRRGTLDAAALNVLEYRQIADALDSTQIVAEAGAVGPEQYLVLVKQDSRFRKVADLRGARMVMLRSPRMCVAPAWLATLLDEPAPAERFFGALTSDGKVARVVLPVFFGQMDACLVSRKGFDAMCELNPQVGRQVRNLATSPAMVVTLYGFRKNYHSLYRERFVKALSGLRATVAGRQLATLFQFEELTVRDAGCMASALAILGDADRLNGRGGRR